MARSEASRGNSAVGFGLSHLLMGERYFVAKAPSGALVSFLGLRSQLASGTEVSVIACSSGRKLWMEAVVFTCLGHLSLGSISGGFLSHLPGSNMGLWS